MWCQQYSRGKTLGRSIFNMISMGVGVCCLWPTGLTPCMLLPWIWLHSGADIFVVCILLTSEQKQCVSEQKNNSCLYHFISRGFVFPSGADKVLNLFYDEIKDAHHANTCPKIDPLGMTPTIDLLWYYGVDVIKLGTKHHLVSTFIHLYWSCKRQSLREPERCLNFRTVQKFAILLWFISPF